MLKVVTGPMFAGKSSYLINYLIANSKVGRSYALFKPASDDRYGQGYVSSHNGAKLPSNSVSFIEEIFTVLLKLDELNMSPSLIAIDETQFFNAKETEETISKLIKCNYDEIICAGLAQNSFGEPFGAMGALMAMADEVIQLPAVCASCKRNKATRTYRKNPSKDRVLVGGSSDYEPRCFNCWSI